ncbi:peptidase T [Desulfitobacterium dichloroeliminans LMG P-21439]|uniref:Peptidase T n=1 Tax=Desulfitobacterium dichloroeliminans (strain LMG P-21439 / DCA1) TaxID=871963 RepID=L0F9N8_DESDL|nr:peptidase T [Desulfitobacterium dichloroeliminans]AGA69658.1 peptidase T [Desulfitobacterium dichloroeliminans LMG P-21439]
MSQVINRFLKYVQMDTQSSEDSQNTPSTGKQLDLAQLLQKELTDLGLSDARIKEGYVYGTLPANSAKAIPALGLIAHMDTSPDFSGENVKPKVIESYDGQEIVLNSEHNLILSPRDFPELLDYIGKSLITTDGTTLLGADDKAGIAEIMTALDYLATHPEVEHGKICVAFTPDEEIGRGADHFDVAGFGADFAYTLDGGPLGELEYENFNAAKAIVKIKGRNVHPGSAKNKMINSILLANEYIAKLPAQETPATTEGYEGFYHINDIKGDVEETTLYYIIRDFDQDSFTKRKATMLNLAEELNQIYGSDAFSLEITDQYQNMKEKIIPFMHIVEKAQAAMEAVGVKPLIQPIRGGTDGARLSFMGLPTPNLFTGGHNYHGRYEFIPTFAMEKSVEVILKIIELYAKEDLH